MGGWGGDYRALSTQHPECVSIHSPFLRLPAVMWAPLVKFHMGSSSFDV